MTNVYEGTPDGRQSSEAIKPTRFRPRYRALTDGEKALHDEIKAKAEELEALFSRVKAGRYNSLAITSLEQSVMWIIKELTHEHEEGAAGEARTGHRARVDHDGRPPSNSAFVVRHKAGS